jgi:signal transduction histidine kinase
VRHEFLEQLDDQLHDDFETAQGLLTRTADGRLVWNGARSDHDLDDARVYEVWSGHGDQMHRSGASAALPGIAPASLGASYRYDTVVAGRELWRTLTSPTTLGGQAVVMRVSRSEEGLRRQLWEILVVLALGLPLVVALAGAGGYLLARRALAPIDRLGTEAQRITAERLHERLTVSNPTDEIGRLTGVINDVFTRLESSFDQLRRFTSDASHELRTPLAVVRSLGEAAVAQRRSPQDYEDAIGSMLEEVDRMTSLVETLLRLSHGDAGRIRVAREAVDLGQLARDVASSLGVLAEERNQLVTLDIVDGIVVSVDRLVLRPSRINHRGPRGAERRSGNTRDCRRRPGYSAGASRAHLSPFLSSRRGALARRRRGRAWSSHRQMGR